MATTLPTTTPAEAASAVAHLHSKGWTEEQVAEFILPFMPPGAGPPAPIRVGRGASAMTWGAG